MRHRMRGRKLGRNASHRKAMFRNMACSFIRSVRVDEDDPIRPKVPGRIVTTLPKAKELRPYVERLVTMGRKAAQIEQQAKQHAIEADRNTDEWTAWRTSDGWQKWNQAMAPALALRRRMFAILRDNQAVDVLLTELAERFADRPGGYTRVVRLSEVRLGDAGQKALIEFVGERDRVRRVKREAPAVVDDEEQSTETPADDKPAEAAEGGDEAAAGAPQTEETTDANEEAKT